MIRCASRKILADEGSNGFHSESLQLSAASDDPIKIYRRIIRLAFLANHIKKIGFNSYEDEQFRFEAK